MRKDSLIESIHKNVKGLDGSSSSSEVEIEEKIRNLQDKEKKLVVAFSKVMANLYLLPGYVLAVSSGVSGLLSGDQHNCWLLICMIVVVLSFLVVLGLAAGFANKQLAPLLLKKVKFAEEKEQLSATNDFLVNQELEFQVKYYQTFLWLNIISCYVDKVSFLFDWTSLLIPFYADGHG